MSRLVVNYSTALYKDWAAIDRPVGNLNDISEWVREYCKGEVVVSANYIHFSIAIEATYFGLFNQAKVEEIVQ